MERQLVTWTHPSLDGAGIHTIGLPNRTDDREGATTVEVYHYDDGTTIVSVYSYGDPKTAVYVDSKRIKGSE